MSMIERERIKRSLLPLTVAALALTGVAGCSQTLPDRKVRMTRGYVFFLDGAGAGGGLKNYSRSIRKGLLAAGYDGGGENFHWQTWLGVTVDQISTEKYKRDRAADVAHKIENQAKNHPGAPITLMGHSAGTAVAVFALEALPEDVSVENVILLSSSLSSEYDLTEALGHVHGRLFFTTSRKDTVLQFLVPLSGTADRARGTTDTLGVEGATMPSSPDEETRTQYTKVIEVPWVPDFKEYGDEGAHSDTVKASFVEAVLGPLVVTNTIPMAPESASEPGKVENPDYRRWAQFAPGSWVQMEGYQEINGQREPVRMKATLFAKSGNRLMIQRVFEPLGQYKHQTALNRLFFASPFITPEHHPLTHPGSKITELPGESIAIGGRQTMCAGQQVNSPHAFPDWGENVEAKVYLDPAIPGGIAKIELKTTLSQNTVMYSGTITDFRSLK